MNNDDDKKFDINNSVENYIKIYDQSVIDHLNEWMRLIQKQDNDDDEWYTISLLPQYRFKNLKIITENSEGNEITEDSEGNKITITLQCDYYYELKDSICNNDKLNICDSCGCKFSGKTYPVKNIYTHEIEDGLIQCENCYKNEIT